MKRFAILAVLLLGVSAASAQTPVRVVTTASDPDGNACTATSPPTILLYNTGSTFTHYICTSSTWSAAATGSIGGTASTTDNAIVRVTGTGGLTVQGYTSNDPTISDAGAANFPGGITGALTGNASTATALAANGSNCSAGSAPLGVDASGAVESCTDYEEDLANSAGLAAALSDETGTGLAMFGTSPTIKTSLCIDGDGDGDCDILYVRDYDGDGSLEIVDDIDAAYGTLEAGDKLIVLPGRYEDPGATSGQSGLLLMDINETTVELMPGAILDGWDYPGDAGINDAVVFISADNTTLRGGEIDGGLPAAATGGDYLTYTSSSQGIYFKGANTTIEDIRVHSTWHACVYGNTFTNVRLANIQTENCGAYNNTGGGNPSAQPCFYVYSTNSSPSVGLTASNISGKQCAAGGFVTRADSGFSGSYLENINVTGATFDDAEAENAFSYALRLRGCRNCSFSDITITNTGGFNTTGATAYWDAGGTWANEVDSNHNISLSNIVVKELPANAETRCIDLTGYNDGVYLSDIYCDNAYTESFQFAAPNRNLVASNLVATNHGQTATGSTALDFVGTWTGLASQEIPIFRNIKLDVALGKGINEAAAMDDITFDGLEVVSASQQPIIFSGATSRLTLRDVRVVTPSALNAITISGAATDPWFSRIRTSGTAGGGTYGISFTGGGSGARIENSTFYSTSRPAISMGTVTGATLSGIECDHTDCVDWTSEQPQMFDVDTFGTYTTEAVDLSGSTATLPQTTDCSGVTGEGDACWDTDDDALYVGDGSAAAAVGAGSTWSTVVKGSDETVSSDSTLSNDSALTFSVAANTTYSFRFVVFVSSTAAADYKFSVTCPASPTAVIMDPAYRAIANTTWTLTTNKTFCGWTQAILGGSDGDAFYIVEGTLLNGANAGTVALQWAQNTSDASNTTVKAGSYLTYYEVP